MNVKQVKNIALTISLLSFAIGFSDLQENIYFWLGRPVGAISLIVFFIFMVLEKEFALFDEEEKKSLEFQTQASATSVRSVLHNKEIREPALTTANSH